MSFRGLFTSKSKKEKHQSKQHLSAQQMYDLGASYLQEFSKITNESSEKNKNNAAVLFFKELHADEDASGYRAAIRNQFSKAYCAENIDFLFNYFEMDSTLSKEQWKAFYHQYVEEDKENKHIEFTEINIDDSQRALFSKLNAKIINGEKDLDKILLDKAITGRMFLDQVTGMLAGYILVRDELVLSAITELQQKAIAAGAVPSSSASPKSPQ